MFSRKLCSVLTPGKRTDKDDSYGKSFLYEKIALVSLKMYTPICAVVVVVVNVFVRGLVWGIPLYYTTVSLARARSTDLKKKKDTARHLLTSMINLD